MFIDPTVEDFQTYFFRDFPYADCDGDDDEDLSKVQDRDIEKAFTQAKFNFNSALWADQSQYTMGFLYLSAHYLVTDLRAASQGVSGTYSWLTSGKGVGSVSESFSIPQKILDNPVYAMLTKTSYGAKFLQLLLPQLVGQVFTVCGRTLP